MLKFQTKYQRYVSVKIKTFKSFLSNTKNLYLQKQNYGFK